MKYLRFFGPGQIPGKTANKLLYLILSVFHHSWHWNSICPHCHCHAICFLLNSGWKHEILAWPKKPLRWPIFASWSPRRPQIKKVASFHPHKIRFCTSYWFFGFLLAKCYCPSLAPPCLKVQFIHIWVHFPSSEKDYNFTSGFLGRIVSEKWWTSWVGRTVSLHSQQNTICEVDCSLHSRRMRRVIITWNGAGFLGKSVSSQFMPRETK